MRSYPANRSGLCGLAAPLDREAGSVTLQPVTRRIAQDVLDGAWITRRFEKGALHGSIPQAIEVAIGSIDSGAAAMLPTVWLAVRSADGRILGDLGTHGLPDSRGCVEIGYSLAPSARGQGVGTAALAAPRQPPRGGAGIRRITAVTGAQNATSRRLLERQGFRIAGTLPGTDEVRYTLSLSLLVTR